ERALGRHAPDQPMRPAAAGAMVDFAIVINCVIAAGARVECGAARLDRTDHGIFLRNLSVPTSGESLGFKDGPCLGQPCHSWASRVFQAETTAVNNPTIHRLWTLLWKI